ncbi:hypothetical protein BDZ97DRAFT_957985 [Flammula alnicola]|nr:hypothetical protein BDZ97DRAFT_957985 [Flammula alnicola]
MSLMPQFLHLLELIVFPLPFCMARNCINGTPSQIILLNCHARLLLGVIPISRKNRQPVPCYFKPLLFTNLHSYHRSAFFKPPQMYIGNFVCGRIIRNDLLPSRLSNHLTQEFDFNYVSSSFSVSLLTVRSHTHLQRAPYHRQPRAVRHGLLTDLAGFCHRRDLEQASRSYGECTPFFSTLRIYASSSFV